MSTIAAFDLGIKNLSYCVADFDASGGLVGVRRWANLNLLADGAESQSLTRCGCGGPASFSDLLVDGGRRILCKKCAKKSAKPVFDGSGTTLAALREYADGIGIAGVKKLKKPEVEAAIAARRLMPYKPPKAKGVSLQALLAGMEKALDTELEWLAHASRIRIENQPSEFAPHMKSVQMILFALVDHRLRREHGWTGAIEFANASVKTKGCSDAGTGKDQKRSRKLAGIARVQGLLTSAGLTERLGWWSAQAKQDDLADALLMCVDGAAT